MTGQAAIPAANDDADDRMRLDALYRTQRPSLISYFRRNRASQADADDMAQETFLRMAGKTAEAAKPRSYLRAIGSNLIKEVASAPVRRYECDAPQIIEEAISEANELGRLEARDTLRRIEAALYRLKPKTREIFLAHRLDGMTYAEIAERTGLNVKSVEKQMSKAIAQVSRAVDGAK